MGITALVMAGGKGTRMKLPVEKPLISVCGKPSIQYVLAALKNAKKIDRLIVATTSVTPKTTAMMKQLGVQVIETPGKDYVSDMGFTVHTLKLGVFLGISADLPLVKGEMIDEIITRYEVCGKPALTVAVPIEVKTKLGMGVEYSFKTEDVLGDVNISILEWAAFHAQEDAENGLIPGLTQERFRGRPGPISDEILGIAIAEYIGGTRGVFEYVRFDQAKPGILKTLGSITNDAIGALVAGVSSNVYTRAIKAAGTTC